MVSSFDYTNDTLGRRTARSDYYINRGSTEANTFGYNAFSEVINAHMGTNTYSYAYDPIGNRDQAAKNSVATDYEANGLNQYTNIIGGITTVPVHDLDGNLASFNGWAYVWNGENRLIQASNDTVVVTYTYDHQGRMVTKTINDVAYRYLWDGYNIIQTLTHSQTHTLTNSFVWGLDLSESLQGAGGVGGLLAEIQDGVPYFTAFDANGNVTEYISASGTAEAHRGYSAFGVTLVSTGAKKDDFAHWWSTKPFDPVTGFSEYEYRKYLPPIGRWVSRDPIDEDGGLLIYGFVDNNPVDKWDLLGMKSDLEVCSHYLSKTYANGFIVCHNGNPLICVRHLAFHDQYPNEAKCTFMHEEVHALLTDCEECGTYRPEFENDIDQNSEECIAYIANLVCLEHYMENDCGMKYDPILHVDRKLSVDAPFCVFGYATRINTVRRKIRQHCGVDPYAK